MVYRSEDILIIYGLTPGIMDTAPIHKTLTEFCKKKKRMVSSDRFNLIVFLKDGPNYLENFTLNPEHILIALKSLEEDLVKGNISAGIFLAIKLIIEVFKSISERSFHLIIILDSRSAEIPNDKVPVLKNVIDKVKEMPLVIDIVSINVDNPSEDFKLKKIAGRTGGDLYKIKKVKELTSILNKLATCSICFHKDMNLIQCTKCNTFAHKNCWALWSKTAHIGVPNIFRCHNCFNLLKLDKDLVEMVHSGILIYEEPQLVDVQKYLDDIKVVDVERYLQSLEAREGPKVVHIEYPMINLNVEDDDITIIMDDE